MRRWIYVLMVGCLLVACAPVAPVTESTAAPAGDEAEAQSTATPGAEVAGPADTAAPAPGTGDVNATPAGRGEGVAIVFERGGGFGGTYDKWTIYADGTIVRADGPEAEAQPLGSVTAEQVSTLVADLDDLGFFQWQGGYGGNDNCADCYQYAVSVTNGGETKTVTTHDAASDGPPELNEALGLIQALLAAAA